MRTFEEYLERLRGIKPCYAGQTGLTRVMSAYYCIPRFFHGIILLGSVKSKLMVLLNNLVMYRNRTAFQVFKYFIFRKGE